MDAEWRSNVTPTLHGCIEPTLDKRRRRFAADGKAASVRDLQRAKNMPDMREMAALPPVSPSPIPAAPGLRVESGNAYQRLRAIPKIPNMLSAPDKCILTEKGSFDAIILFDGWSPLALNTVRLSPCGQIVPVINLSGSHLAWADYSASTASAVVLADALHKVQPIIRRIAELPETVKGAHEDDLILLARMWTRDAALTPKYDPASKLLISYPLAGPLPAPQDVAWSLSELARIIHQGWRV
jgi:hypothetical protein